ncbi:MAG: ClpXP protease specificity-enhancing factor [Burkholderiales bacterium]|nr:ClpXP protease specificity-enhancing factor [Burkholderiales bacterium]
MSEISTKPYFLRAIYEWCTDNGFTPYVSVRVSGAVQVPMEFVRKGEIVLNISFGATSGLKMDNDAISFKARFGGVSREIRVPVSHVQAIFASENGQGMVFDAVSIEEESAADAIPEASKPSLGLAAVSVPQENAEKEVSTEVTEAGTKETQKKSEKPSLKVVK